VVYEFDLIPDIYGLDGIGLDVSMKRPDWIGLGLENGPRSNSAASPESKAIRDNDTGWLTASEIASFLL